MLRLDIAPCDIFFIEAAMDTNPENACFCESCNTSHCAATATCDQVCCNAHGAEQDERQARYEARFERMADDDYDFARDARGAA